MTKVLAITSDWGDNEYRRLNHKVGGVGYYRLQQPLTQGGFEFDLFGANLKDQIDHSSDEELVRSYKEFVSGYDIVITKVIDNSRAFSTMLGVCDMAGVPLVVDVDDNFLEVLPTQPAYEKGYAKGGKPRVVAAAGASFANAIFVSTDPLKTYLLDYYLKTTGELKPIYTLPNCLVAEHWDIQSKTNKNKVVIGYHGSTTHNQDLEIVLPHIAKLMDKYTNVHFCLLGGMAKENIGQLGVFSDRSLERVSVRGGTRAWEGFPELLMAQKWDIGIAPLTDCEFNRGKSHIKWLEISQKGIPTVASPVYPYKEPIQGVPVIEEGETGFFAKDDEWFDVLERLILDRELRERVGNTAKEVTRANWQYRDHVHKWKEAIEQVIANHK